MPHERHIRTQLRELIEDPQRAYCVGRVMLKYLMLHLKNITGQVSKEANSIASGGKESYNPKAWTHGDGSIRDACTPSCEWRGSCRYH